MQNSVKYLKKNKIIIFPAETLYGFSCSLYARDSIKKVFEMKNRQEVKQFIVLVKSFEMASEIVDIDDFKLSFLKKYNYWPNHLTIVFKSKIKDYNTLALRYSNSKYITELFKKINFPIISTSVNYSNEPPMLNLKDIIKEFDKNIAYINTSSPDGTGKASTIVDFTTSEINLIREGELSYKKMKEDYNEFRNNNK